MVDPHAIIRPTCCISGPPRKDNNNAKTEDINILFVKDWDKCCRQNPAVAFSHLGSEPIWNELVESTVESFFGDAIMDKVLLTLPTAEKEIYECLFNMPNVSMDSVDC